jgi:putative ABC transport system permease protein
MVSELGRPMRKGEVVVGSQMISLPGEILTFYGKNFTVAGKLDPSGMGMDESAFIMLDDAYRMAAESGGSALAPVDIREGEISAVLIRVKPGFDKDQVAAAIQATIPGTHPVTLNYIASKVNRQLSATTQVLLGITAAVTLVSFPFMALISTMVANERRRELSLLRAMGATRGFVFRIVLAEALVIAAAGGFAGVALSGLLLSLFEPLVIGTLQMPFLWPSIGSLIVDVTIVILVAIIVGGAASLIPAIRSSRIEPYDGIRRFEQ